jgi:hypothetical protein
MWSNIVVKRLTLLLRIREVSSSNIGLDTSYSDWSFHRFFSALAGKCRDSTLQLGHDHFLQHLFQLIIHLWPLHLKLYSPSHWKSVIKNNKVTSHIMCGKWSFPPTIHK